jgi:hypothetical protein
MKRYRCIEDYILNGEKCFTKGRKYIERNDEADVDLMVEGYIRFHDDQYDFHDLSIHVVNHQFIEINVFTYGK